MNLTSVQAERRSIVGKR